ncbi:MAG: sigma-70 family RNA polymerase sigma factor [bacterium]
MSNEIEQQVAVEGAVPVEPDGEEFARRFKNGEDGAFDGLVRAFQSRMYNLAYRLLHSHEDADEATQEIFVKVHGAIGDFEGRSKFTTWLYAVGLNICRNKLRQTKRRALFEVRSLDDPPESGPPPPEASTPRRESPPAQMERAELMRLVHDSIAELPAEFAEAVILRDLQGMSYEDVAVAIGCSIGTVKSRIARGREAVKERLRPHLKC